MINRPQPDEYSAFAARYVDLVDNEPISEKPWNTLQQMHLTAFFINLDPAKAGYAYAEGKWTIKQVLGHMCDTERVFAYRALVFLPRIRSPCRDLTRMFIWQNTTFQ